MDLLQQDSLHPMVRFKVIGYRTENINHAIVQDKPKPIPIEAKREYHIGLIYPHRPKYEGVLYQEVIDLGAHFSDDYIEAFKKLEYRDHVAFNQFQLRNCPHCNPQGPYELIDERKAPGA